jgi:hypothetical protein
MVAMNVWPTDASDGSVATEARWRKMGRIWQRSGVIAGQGGELAPSLVFPNLTVQAGAAWVDGHYCELLGSQVLTVTANGIVVVRFDPAANTAELLYRDGATTPTQNPTGTWELLIAQVSGSALVDQRGTLLQTTEVKPYCRFAQPAMAIPPGGPVNIVFAGLVEVTDPNAMIGANYIVIPAGWSGLWSFDLVWDFGTHASAGAASGWVESPGPLRHGQANMRSDPAVGWSIGTSAIISAAAGSALTFWAQQQNPTAMAIGLRLSATWLGRSPTLP